MYFPCRPPGVAVLGPVCGSVSASASVPLAPPGSPEKTRRLQVTLPPNSIHLVHGAQALRGGGGGKRGGRLLVPVFSLFTSNVSTSPVSQQFN